jgi:hypothetical protein
MRRDWVKGSRALGEGERQTALRAHRAMLALPRDSVLLKVRGALGEATLPESTYCPVLDAPASHHPASLTDIEKSVHGRGITLPLIVKAVTLLAGAGVVLNVRDGGK